MATAKWTDVMLIFFSIFLYWGKINIMLFTFLSKDQLFFNTVNIFNFEVTTKEMESSLTTKKWPDVMQIFFLCSSH